MKTYLVTGAAGFIGANFIKHMLAKYDDIKIVVLDLLTYAGNLGTIAEDIDGVRCEFVKGDTPHEKHGLPVRPRQVIRYGVKVYVSIKSLPMRSMEA